MGSLGMGCRGRLIRHFEERPVRVRREVRVRPVFVPRNRALGLALEGAGVRPLNVRAVGVRLLSRMAEVLHKRYSARDLEIDLSAIVEDCVVSEKEDAAELRKVLEAEGLEAGEVFRSLFPEVG